MTESFEKFIVRRRVPIVFTVLFVGLLQWAMGVHQHALLSLVNWYQWVGFTLIALGTLVRFYAAGIIHKNAQLAMFGPYKIVRHPLYFGSILTIFGFVILLQDIVILALVLGVVMPVYYCVMRFEDQRLARLFGDAWYAFAAKTHMIIPRLPVELSFENWSLQQAGKNGEWKVLAVTIGLLVGLDIWRVAQL